MEEKLAVDSSDKCPSRTERIASALLSLSPGDTSLVRRYFYRMTPDEANVTDIIAVDKVLGNAEYKMANDKVFFCKEMKDRDIWKLLKIAEANNHFQTSTLKFRDAVKQSKSPQVLQNVIRLSLIKDANSHEFFSLLQRTLRVIGTVDLVDLINFVAHWNVGYPATYGRTTPSMRLLLAYDAAEMRSSKMNEK